MSDEAQCVSGMSEQMAAAAWRAVQERHEAAVRRVTKPATAAPVSTTTYTASDTYTINDPPGTNPKDAAATGKLPLDLWPATASAMGSIAMLNGSLKYGRANWRTDPIRASVYVAACQRHLAAWYDGEDADEEGVPHLASILANIAVMVDALAANTLIDDRPPAGGYRTLANQLFGHVSRLRQLHGQAAK